MRKILILFLAALPLGATELVRDGQPLAEIVISEQADPSVKTAARELQKYLKKMSGAELAIVAGPTGKTPVYVGRSAFTDKLEIKLDDVKDDGFKIIAKDDYVALLGVDQCRPPIPRGNTKFGLAETLRKKWQEYTGRKWDYPGNVRDSRNFSPDLGFHIQDANGTLYAVYEFLESLGMRWFMPIEELGEVIPERRTIKVQPMELKKEPQIASRYLLLVGIGNNPAEFLWYKYLKQGGIFDQFSSHSSENVCQYDHPEMIVHSGGKLVTIGTQKTGRPPRYLPRLSSPQLRADLAEYLIKFNDAFPEVPYLPIGVPDGWNVLDDEDVAAGWDKKNEGNAGRFSDYAWDFVCDVAKRVNARRPNVQFRTSSYGYAKKPPKSMERIPAGIAVNLAQGSTMPGFADDLALRAEWLRKSPNGEFFIYDYYTYHAPKRKNPPVPAVFSAQMEKNFKALPERCRGIYTELAWSWPRQHNLVVGLPGINHLMIYLHSKFTWDKNLDVKATLADYYEKFYGPAKEEMREFFEYSEEIWIRPGAREITVSGGFLKPADVPKYFEILDRAKAKAGGSIYGRRIDFIAAEIAPLKKLFSGLERTGPLIPVAMAQPPAQMDGDLGKPLWRNATGEQKWLSDCVTGASPKENKTSVDFRWLPDSSLLVGITCYERRMSGLQANTPASLKDEQTIYKDDTVEVHLETPAGYRAVIVVNPNAAVRDTCVTPDVAEVPEAWNVEQVAVRKLEDRWSVEIKVKGIGNMPTKAYPWGVNVFRQRRAGGTLEAYALSPTGKGFISAPGKMGNLYVR